jgi:hypothetical protein
MKLNKNYIIKNLPYIMKNKNHFIEHANLAHKRYELAYKYKFNNKSSTWLYKYYNITCLTSESKFYYKMFYDLQKIIRKFSKTKKPLWYQSWLNFHKQDEVLDWHNHNDCLFHGYISIDPKNSETDFEDYVIKNKIGNIYIGPGSKKHKVNVLKKFDGHRITIGFDVISENEINLIYKKYGKLNINLSYIPIYI